MGSDGRALSHNEIERAFPKHDRVTIYRTLQTFVQKGIIHNIPSSEGNSKYALCQNGCAEDHHHDEHIHFVCNKCGTTQCLDTISFPVIKMPSGFLPQKTEVVVSGTCNHCTVN